MEQCADEEEGVWGDVGGSGPGRRGGQGAVHGGSMDGLFGRWNAGMKVVGWIGI